MMKKNKLINRLLVALAFAALATGCSDDGGDEVSAGFAGIASTIYEGNGIGAGDITVTVPVVNGSLSVSDLVFDGSATQGEDYEVLGVTSEGLEIKFIDDNDCEDRETVRVRISKGAENGNSLHTITLIDNNNEGTTDDIAGTYVVVTDAWEDYDEGDEITVEAVDATHIRIMGYPATSFNAQPLVVTLTNAGSGASTVESQNNGSYDAGGTQAVTTTGTGTISNCNGIDLTLTFVLPCCGTFADNHLVLEKAPAE